MIIAIFAAICAFSFGKTLASYQQVKQLTPLSPTVEESKRLRESKKSLIIVSVIAILMNAYNLFIIFH